MARLARVVLPGHPHHITQRGNRRQDVFFCDEDYQLYLHLLKEWSAKEGLEVWAYCLMTNHVHLIVKPDENSDMSRAIGEMHRRYTRHINFREGWRGFLWQGRFSSFPMDEDWLLKALSYVELNPVKAGMVEQPWDYRWSSVHAHLSGNDPDGIVKTEPLLPLTGDWREYLKQAIDNDTGMLEKHERTGRVLGSDSFVEQAEQILGRNLRKKKPGPKSRKQLN